MPNFSTPLSGLQAQSAAIEIVGNNLANLNTTGFKASTASFRDVIAASLGAGSSLSQIGLGVQAPIATRQFQQGSIQLTGGAFNAAIQGDGFFVVRDTVGRQLYTRAGNFKIDADGNLLTESGESVQGWSTTTGGTLVATGGVSNIQIPLNGTTKPLPTQNFSVDLNLDAGAAVAGPNATFSTPVQVVDSLGATHVLTATFTKTGANAWSYDISIPGADLTAGVVGTPSSVKSGTLTFNSSGVLTAPAPPPPATNGVVTVPVTGLKNGAANLSMSWSLYDPKSEPPDQSVQPDLFRVGDGPRWSGSGGSVANQPLRRRQHRRDLHGRTAVKQSQRSRSPRFPIRILWPEPATTISKRLPRPPIRRSELPDSGGRGKILSGSLEASTVDIAKEFTNLIVYQRGYQANSRVITTLDELSQDTINIKR